MFLRFQHIFDNYFFLELGREQMILLALLVGSDYTIGLSGIGPVTALEILAAFPPNSEEFLSGLKEFRSWFDKGKLPGPRKTSLRGKLKNLQIKENFPSLQVAQAYLEPKVEKSKENFSWAKPDVPGLIEFAQRKFGWNKKKCSEILDPVLKKMDTKNQKSIRDYFKSQVYKNGEEAIGKKISKRVKSALDKIGKTISDEEEEREVKKKRVCKKDEELNVLKETKARSKKRVKEIENEVKNVIKDEVMVKPITNLHKKEVIPQKEKEKSDMLKNKLKAIETFRKSKQGPGFVKKKSKTVKVKETASYLSDSSD